MKLIQILLLFYFSNVTAQNDIPQITHVNKILKKAEIEGIRFLEKIINPTDLYFYLDISLAVRIIDIEFKSGFYELSDIDSSIVNYKIPKHTLKIAFNANEYAIEKIHQYYLGLSKKIESDTICKVYQRPDDFREILGVLVSAKGKAIQNQIENDFIEWRNLLKYINHKESLLSEKEKEERIFNDELYITSSNIKSICLNLAIALNALDPKKYDKTFLNEQNRLFNKYFLKDLDFRFPNLQEKFKEIVRFTEYYTNKKYKSIEEFVKSKTELYEIIKEELGIESNFDIHQFFIFRNRAYFDFYVSDWGFGCRITLNKDVIRFEHLWWLESFPVF